MKKCSSCDNIKEDVCFYNEARVKSGLSSRCKVCIKKANDLYVKNNLDKVKKQKALYRALYYAKNPDKLKAHRDMQKCLHKEWVSKNRDRVRQISRKNKKLKKNIYSVRDRVYKKHVTQTLSDSYIRRTIKQESIYKGIPPEYLNIKPEFIEIKRIIIKTKREIKKAK